VKRGTPRSLQIAATSAGPVVVVQHSDHLRLVAVHAGGLAPDELAELGACDAVVINGIRDVDGVEHFVIGQEHAHTADDAVNAHKLGALAVAKHVSDVH